MYSPFILELVFEYPGLNLQLVEYEIVKELKHQFKFKETEIVDGKIELRNGFPSVYKCEFKRDNIGILVVTFNDEPLKEVLQVLSKYLDFNNVTVRQVELMGFQQTIDTKKLFNFNFEDDEILKYDLEFTIGNKDSTHTTFRFNKVTEDSPNLAVISSSFNKKVVNQDDLITYIVEKKINLIQKMDKYILSQEGNMIFGEIEVVNNE